MKVFFEIWFVRNGEIKSVYFLQNFLGFFLEKFDRNTGYEVNTKKKDQKIYIPTMAQGMTTSPL